ncbi:MAG: flagellar basal body P-ring formation protein FlgA [Alphaproteobacteria bacterium]|nr:MAG: flagellar basal body P-ring formation protein FlgA [Alphaproteobacteria bacterium]
MSRILLICLVLLSFSFSAHAEEKATVTPRVITDAELIAAVKAAALDQGYGSNVQVRVSRNGKNLISMSANDQIILDNLEINKAAQSFTVEASLSDSPKQRINFAGRIISMISVPVLSTQRNAGETIEDADIAFVDMEQASLGNSAITNVEQLVGKTAKRLIASGSVIRTGMVSAPIVVRKNDLITMLYQTEYLTISHQARALNDGAMGDTIRALNTQTNKILDAVVTGSDQATVGITSNSKKSVAAK